MRDSRLQICFALAMAGILGNGCSRASAAVDLTACQKATTADAAVASCSVVAESKDASPEQRATALAYRGGAFNAKGMRKEAMADLDESVRLLPESAEMLANRGAIKNIQGNLDESMTDLEAALRLDPRNVMALGNRGIVREKRGEFLAARADIDSAISIDPEVWQPWAERCWIGAVLADELPKTLADCDHAIGIQSRDPNLYNSRGLVHFRMGQFPAAIADYDRAIEDSPGIASSWLVRGLAKRAAGIEGAQADIDKGKSMDPTVAARYAGYGVKSD